MEAYLEQFCGDSAADRVLSGYWVNVGTGETVERAYLDPTVPIPWGGYWALRDPIRVATPETDPLLTAVIDEIRRHGR